MPKGDRRTTARKNNWRTLEGTDNVPTSELATRPRLLVSRDILAWAEATRVAPLRYRRQNWDIVHATDDLPFVSPEDTGAPPPDLAAKSDAS